MQHARPSTLSAVPTARPFVVAHRLGNDLQALQNAVGAGGDLVEADLRLFRGRVEVRHLKSVGPLPILWDGWAIAGRGTARLPLEELLDGAPAETGLLLDLKGFDPRLAGRVQRALEVRPNLIGRVVLCARNWRLLTPFCGPDGRGRNHAVVRSVRTSRELRAAIRALGESGGAPNGFAAHQELLDRDSVQALRAKGSVLMSWPVNDVPTARRLIALGVDGLISDAPEKLDEVVRESRTRLSLTQVAV